MARKLLRARNRTFPMGWAEPDRTDSDPIGSVVTLFPFCEQHCFTVAARERISNYLSPHAEHSGRSTPVRLCGGPDWSRNYFFWCPPKRRTKCQFARPVLRSRTVPGAFGSSSLIINRSPELSRRLPRPSRPVRFAARRTPI